MPFRAVGLRGRGNPRTDNRKANEKWQDVRIHSGYFTAHRRTGSSSRNAISSSSLRTMKLPIVAVRIGNPDRVSFRIQS